MIPKVRSVAVVNVSNALMRIMMDLCFLECCMSVMLINGSAVGRCDNYMSSSTSSAYLGNVQVYKYNVSDK